MSVGGGHSFRYIPNDADLACADIPGSVQRLREGLLEAVQTHQMQYPANSDVSVNSLGRRKTDYSLYTGSSGNIFLYHRLRSLSPELETYLETAIQTALRVINQNRDPLDPPSFFMGTAGVSTLIAVIHRNDRLVSRVLADAQKTTHPSAQDELLYGTAGYLYCLLYILKHWPDSPQRLEVIKTINEITARLVKDASKNGIIKFAFPKGRGEMYLGAAHGVAGVLQMMMLARGYLETDYDELIRRSLDYLISAQLPSGNFPVCAGEDVDEMVHFCHGATGVVFTLCTAFSVYGSSADLAAAERAGLEIWRRGLLRKGRGLCHGTAGNAYALLSLYRTTGDVLWLHRAIVFASKSMFCPLLDAEIRGFDDPQRLKRGVADTPFSLMEGMAGTLCFYYDVLHPSESAFPGYEL